LVLAARGGERSAQSLGDRMTFDGLNGSRGPRVGRPFHGAE